MDTPRTVKLEQLSIASPCHESWESMTGDDKSRFCGKCQLQVHNLSAMSRADAEQLVNTHSGRLCVQYAKVDQKVQTIEPAQKPETIYPFRRWSSIAAMALAYVGLTGLMAFAGESREVLKGDVACPSKPPEAPATQPAGRAIPNPAVPAAKPELMLGKVACQPEPVVVAGMVSMPTTRPAGSGNPHSRGGGKAGNPPPKTDNSPPPKLRFQAGWPVTGDLSAQEVPPPPADQQ